MTMIPEFQLQKLISNRRGYRYFYFKKYFIKYIYSKKNDINLLVGLPTAKAIRCAMEAEWLPKKV
jgi:hypothetical protein